MKSTEGLSQGLKSISASKAYWAHQRGLDSEDVVRKFYERQGYELLAQRLRTPFAEIDLLFKTEVGHVLMVEVKTSNISDFQPHRISKKQKERQKRALLYLTSQLECLVEVHWAFVTKAGDVSVIEDVSG